MNTKRMLAVSAAAGILAAILSYVWFSGKEGALNAMSAPTPALVAAEYIAGGARLDKSMLEVKQFPRAFIQPGALRSPEEAVGLVALAPFAPGEQILANKLAATGVALALAVPPGKRAVTVAVDPASSVAGLLKPGDLVDVIVTVDDGGRLRTFMFMQASPVLAVGRAFSARAPNDTGETSPLAGPEADTITLAASPHESEQLMHIEQTGRIKLVLRAQGDKERIPLPAVSGPGAIRPSGGEAEEVRRR